MLLASLSKRRTAQMQAITATIQKEQNQIIRDVKFKTFGCGAAVATSSMATELVKGKNIQEAMEVTNKAVMEALDGFRR